MQHTEKDNAYIYFVCIQFSIIFLHKQKNIQSLPNIVSFYNIGKHNMVWSLFFFNYKYYLLYQKNMSRTLSQIIQAQDIEWPIQYTDDRQRFKEFEQRIKRRSHRVKMQGRRDLDNKDAFNLAQKFRNITIHKLSIPELEKQLNTNVRTGLSSQEAWERYDRDGLNKLKDDEGPHWSIILLKQMITPLSIPLWVSVVLYFILYGVGGQISNLYLGLIIVGIILITGLLTFRQIQRKEQMLMPPFKDFFPPQTIVIRDGREMSMDATRLVVGDVVRIELGKKIPADIRIIQSNGMKVDNSILTGQTMLLKRSPQCTSDNYMDTQNMVFYSTLNREGSALGVVVATGHNTFIGCAVSLQSKPKPLVMSRLQQNIQKLLKRLAIFSHIIALIFFGLGLAIGYPIQINLYIAIGLITANTPMCLIIQLSYGMILGMINLGKRRVLLKDFDSIYNLASLTTICTDKAGTLTLNKMVASNICYNSRIHKAQNLQKLGIQHSYEYNINDAGFKRLQKGAILSSNARFDRNNERFDHKLPYLEWPTFGESSEVALINFFQPIEDISSIRDKFPVVKDKYKEQCKIPFNSLNKYASSVHLYETMNSHFCVFMKGAPEKVWRKCSYINYGGKNVPKNEEEVDKFQKIIQQFGRKGQRMLAFASRHLPKDKYPQNYNFDVDRENLLNDLCFLGIITVFDPPRDSVPIAVLKCKSAGVRVILITGDQPYTAAVAARKCNIITEETVNQIADRTGRTFDECFKESDAIVIHGDQITKMSIEDEGKPEKQQGKAMKQWLTKGEIVFARTSPAHKLIITRMCKLVGDVVATTGDGVGDSPALKTADAGFAMGITGTDVAKDAADAILLNDDFYSIVVAIEEARRISDNVKKSICYALTSQVSQMIPFIAFVILQIPCLFTCALILYTSIGIDLIPTIALGIEEGEADIMTRRPLKKRERIVSASLLAHSYGYMGWIQLWGAILCFYVTFNDFGFPPSQLTMLANVRMVKPSLGDVYNPTHPTFGNTYLQQIYSNSCPPTNESIMVDWLYSSTASYDLRQTLLTCTMNGSTAVYRQAIEWGSCKVQQVSPFTNLPVCYSAQAAKYAQTAYLIGLVWGQTINFLLCRTRTPSVFTQRVTPAVIIALSLQVMLLIAVAYFYPFNTAFGTRDVIFMHFGTAALPFVILMLVIDQIRKFVLRNLAKAISGKLHWFARAAMW